MDADDTRTTHEKIRELEREVRRLQAENADLTAKLAKAEYYRVAVSKAPVGIMCTSHAEGKYVFSNPAHAGFLGYTPDEIVASDPHERWIQITHPEDWERERRDFQRLAQGEIECFTSERRCVSKTGEIRWARVSVAGVRDGEGRLSHICVYFVDTSEHHAALEAREKLEAQLRQSQKLEALGRLAGGVAHDFNNRLVIIMGYAELLRRSLKAGDVQAHQAEMVLQSAKRAAELTRQLLAYSRRQVLKPTAFDLNLAVEGMRRLLERLIGDDIELVTVCGARGLVYSDSGQIEQVILNLALNARDAMARGGRLTIETRDRSVETTDDAQIPPGKYVELIVADTGAGIPEDALPRIFEPFFTTKEIGLGTGLGLATVEGIVRQSGGTVQVESRLGSGSTFTVCLPRAEAPAASRPPPRLEDPVETLQSETVLVCDDDEGVRKLVIDVLTLRTYTVLEAQHGADALRVAREHEGVIHLLVTDLVMPGMSGTELAAELCKTYPALKVLYISGYTDDVNVLSGTLDGGARFLSKPFLPGELVRVVRSLLVDAPNSRP